LHLQISAQLGALGDQCGMFDRQLIVRQRAACGERRGELFTPGGLALPGGELPAAAFVAPCFLVIVPAVVGFAKGADDINDV
jgi:hypothetical protein